MAKTSIEWCDATWNPVRGCARVSPGCEHCYAERVAHRFSGTGGKYEGLTVLGKQGPRWAGRARFVPEKLGEPLRWKKPRRVFVNSMSDLFHEDVTNEQIAAVFGVMAAAPQHTFQVLTKRPKRALEWYRWLQERGGLGPYIRSIRVDGDRGLPNLFGPIMRTEVVRGKKVRSLDDPWLTVFNAAGVIGAATLTNLWLGVSAEDQQRANERVPVLRRCPAFVHFLSMEPLLEHVTLDERWLEWLPCGPDENDETRLLPPIRWVIIGGESGPGARPSDIAWHRSIIEQCKAAGVAVFEKQLGALPTQYSSANECLSDHVAHVRFLLRDRKGADMADWPADLRVRQFPEAQSP